MPARTGSAVLSNLYAVAGCARVGLSRPYGQRCAAGTLLALPPVGYGWEGGRFQGESEKRDIEKPRYRKAAVVTRIEIQLGRDGFGATGSHVREAAGRATECAPHENRLVRRRPARLDERFTSARRSRRA